MQYFFYIAALLLIGVGLAHSYLGERYILIRLFRNGKIPKLFGGPEFTVNTLRFAWHITTIAWFGLAMMFIILANSNQLDRDLSGVLAVTLLTTAVTIIFISKGRHLAWIVFMITGAIALYSAST